MTQKNPLHSELHDRLLDCALREQLGGETPPDLTEQILSAANVPSSSISPPIPEAPTPEEPTMNGKPAKIHLSSNRWLLLAVAASLLIATGLLLPGDLHWNRGNLTQLRSPNSESNLQSTPAKPSNQQKLAEFLKRSDGPVELQEQSAVSQEQWAEHKTTPAPEFDKVGAISTLGKNTSTPHDTKSRQDMLPDSVQAIDRVAGSEPLMMSATPHIIIQAEEEERLGIAQDSIADDARSSPATPTATAAPAAPTDGPASARAPLSGAGFVPQDNLGLQGLIDDAAPESRTTFGFPEANGKAGHPERLARGEGRLRRQPMPLFGRAVEPSAANRPVSGDRYAPISENSFTPTTGEAAVSTFSIDVDTASYANVRQFITQAHRLPPPNAVRIEELINYFDYDYAQPTNEIPFASQLEIASCPWQPEHRLLRIGIQGREVPLENRPPSNLVFLIDVSGSMNKTNKLPLLIEGLKLLTRKLGENDRVAIVVYASSEGLVLPSTQGDQQETILSALKNLRAGGSTAGGAGIELAYQIAQDHFIEGGINRVILATDGDFNVGTTSTEALAQLAATRAKTSNVFLTVLGFGRGNLNDAMMEAISGRGNGNYHYIDNLTEARKVLIEAMAGTLMTIAKDVKIQIEFNPAQVVSYRLIGYENRKLQTQDFNDDKKDAGEIGAGHSVTALYELVPAGLSVANPATDPLKYQSPPPEKKIDFPVSDELLTLKIRYKEPTAQTSKKIEFSLKDTGQEFATATADFQFAAAVASFGMLLRNSEYAGTSSYESVLEIAGQASQYDPHGHRVEFMELVLHAQGMSK